MLTVRRTRTSTTAVPDRTAPSVEEYTDAEGVVRTAGLRSAVDDWQDGLVDTDLLREIIDQWKSGEPVE